MAQQVDDDQKFTSLRLPTHLQPSRYELHLEPDLESFTFKGHVRIDLECKNASIKLTREIVLHSLELVIRDGYLESSDGTHNCLKKVSYSKISETATLEFEEPLDVSMRVLSLNFGGILNDQMNGFYRTSFKLDNRTVYAATTYFEPTNARKAFPCWDEPSFRAVFSISLTYVSKLSSSDHSIVALSNTSEKSSCIVDKDKTKVVFHDTPSMSTYLIAMIVGPFHKLSGSDGKRPVNIYCAAGAEIDRCKFALDITCKSLRYYEDYFGIPYVLPKMDIVAVPDFTIRAMENWGLMTFRETSLLCDEIGTELSRKKSIAVVVAHELAHQWFGNLVTLSWWTHLWLKEGFATFMSYLCIDSLYPEYNIWSEFVSYAYRVAMDLDSLKNTHPIEVDVAHSSEIKRIFDEISYRKGSSVIRMIYDYVGDEQFRKAMKSYLEEFAYRSAATNDLWNALERISNKPIGQIMNNWTTRENYPWISMELVCDTSDFCQIELTQSKFTANEEDESESKWFIPISAYKGSTESSTCERLELTLLDDKKGTVTIPGLKREWIKLNAATIGFYRVRYPPEVLDRLCLAISNKTIPADDRLGIQDDYYALCRYGKVSTVDCLKLLTSFKEETDYGVWTSIHATIGALNMLFRFTTYQDKFTSFALGIYKNIYQKLGWDLKPDEHPDMASTRSVVLNRLVGLGHPEVIEIALKRFRSHIQKSQMIPAELRSVVYRAVATYAEPEDFEKLFELHRNCEAPEEKNRIAASLGFVKVERLNRAFEFIMSDEVRKQDKTFALIPMGPTNPPEVWQLFKANAHKFSEMFGCTRLMTLLVRYWTENFATEEMACEIESFFKENHFPGMEITVGQSIELIRLRVEWLKRDSSVVETFLSKYSNS